MAHPNPQTRSILQIVPRRTIGPDGIGDYAVHLAEGLRERHDIRSAFLSGTPQRDSPARDDGWPSTFVTERTIGALGRSLREAADRQPFSGVILHVGGYGYAKRGAPVWLLRGMRQWSAIFPRTQLLCIFHELYASGKPWNSSFWLGPLQKHVARQLWNLADAGITTNSRYLSELVAWRPAMTSRVALMPVFSNMGEPASVPKAGDRPHKAMVFGLPGIESVVYEQRSAEVASVVETLGITEIVDVGSRRVAPPAAIGGATIKVRGRLPAAEISQELSDCRFGLMVYDIARLGKSTVFAAYAAHGVVPVCIGSKATPADGLVSGRHLLQPPVGRIDTVALDAMQKQLLKWYNDHSPERVVDKVAAMCVPQCIGQDVSSKDADGVPSA